MGVCRVSSAAKLVDTCLHSLACDSEFPQQNILDHPLAPQSRSQFWSGHSTSDETVAVPILSQNCSDLTYFAASCLGCAVTLPYASSSSVQHVGCHKELAETAASLCLSCRQVANSRGGRRFLGASVSTCSAPALAVLAQCRDWVCGFSVVGLETSGLGQPASHDWCCACCHGQLSLSIPNPGPSIWPTCPHCSVSEVSPFRVRQVTLLNPYVPSGEPVHIIFTISIPAARPLSKSVSNRLGTQALPELQVE